MNKLIKTQVPILIQDPYLLARRKTKLVEGTFIRRAAFFDGPETDRISVLDDNDEFNKLKLRAKFSAPGEWSKKTRTGRYLSSDNVNLLHVINEAHKARQIEMELALIEKSEFLQLNAFGIIEKTIDLIEDENLIGRSLRWYYPDSKLYVYVRAMKREKLNAGYTRVDQPPHQRIRFYYKTDVATLENVTTVFASLSRDIVSHETAHAIIDGINSSLYDFRISKHCVAIHEALADITSLFLAFKSGTLTKEVLKKNRGNLDQESQITFWGEVFELIGQKDQRSFMNNSHLDEQVKDEYAGDGDAYRHAGVLCGSIFSVLVSMFNLRKKELAVEIGPKNPKRTQHRTKVDPEFSVSGEAMQHVLRRLPLLLYRAVDYLPRAEVSLADFGRAMLLVDHNLFGPNTTTAGLLREEFLRRKIFQTPQNAVVEWPLIYPETPSVQQLLSGDTSALFNFINKNREWLGIPPDIMVDPEKNCQWIMPIAPPVSRTFFDSTNFRESPQALLKIFWTCNDNQKIEGNQLIIHAGTTIIFDISLNQIIGRLICAPPRQNMFVSELVQSAYESQYWEHRRKIRGDVALDLKAVTDEFGAVPENVDRETYKIVTKDGIIQVIGQGISDIRDG